MARRHPDRAIALARSLRREWGLRVPALGSIAVTLASADRQRAFDLIDEAANVRPTGEGPLRYGPAGGWQAIAHLAHLAQFVGYPDVEGLVLQAMSGRRAPDPRYGVTEWPPGDLEVAGELAGVDVVAARHALQGALRDVGAGPPTPGLRVGTLMGAAALADPEWALELAQQVPAGDPDYADLGGPKASACFLVASSLARALDEWARPGGYAMCHLPDRC